MLSRGDSIPALRSWTRWTRYIARVSFQISTRLQFAVSSSGISSKNTGSHRARMHRSPNRKLLNGSGSTSSHHIVCSLNDKSKIPNARIHAPGRLIQDLACFFQEQGYLPISLEDITTVAQINTAGDAIEEVPSQAAGRLWRFEYLVPCEGLIEPGQSPSAA
ncbi:hypothetical protein BU26DRAFT_515025 [Trematosphaeria pertusa]|uniref:Uncharacterized protein n=1 Tax=Trematosphaeria pertusa TaxID=390896 RepID=A0A6A6IZ18_9PLEO|nr:uncharacterized protein BU26DRAFT_515025 [Trematosphaeria pertusa]KAF2255297.1 hypothetical protein BU26DRAFT_515025 [Trematosphaeria pertusa]